ncbi:hypothetical protein HPO96_29255 [Kribbella sandramycini]|uniref:Uncharacterized protein n=1 Tax=Kribbella sandramycini TaxID=60450 RepID=A0A7Y4P2S3_9ACTN|nr:hypothetical protein [Kribbella sandramycini]MBB6571698.1 hypothetical protein [Kribbella sandramycini]NOL44343.1 hypothetical protein [Kribbella sandramycini]
MLSSYTESKEFELVGQPARVAVDVLAEAIQRSPADAAQLYETVQEIVADEWWERLWERQPRRRKAGRRHWLCQILSEVADMLDELGDVGGMVADDVYAGCVDAGWGPLRSKAASMIAGHLAAVTLGPALAPLATVSLKVRLVAVMFCPDTGKHPALENGCARQVLEALGLPGTVAA